jgi:hypothetical protein
MDNEKKSAFESTKVLYVIFVCANPLEKELHYMVPIKSVAVKRYILKIIRLI